VPPEIHPDAYLMVNQLHWEDNVIFNGDEVRQVVLDGHKQRSAMAGWVPSLNVRTYAQYKIQSECYTRPSEMSRVQSGNFRTRKKKNSENFGMEMFIRFRKISNFSDFYSFFNFFI